MNRMQITVWRIYSISKGKEGRKGLEITGEARNNTWVRKKKTINSRSQGHLSVGRT